MQAAMPKSLTTTTGGLTMPLSTQRSVTLANPADPLGLTSQSDTVNINSRTSTSVYNAATKTTTSTSAAGRTATATIDLQGRLTQAQVTGFLPVSYSYDTRGRLLAARRAQGPRRAQRVSAITVMAT
jgi:YD repeat-containing protein